MNCKEANLVIAGLTGRELPKDLADHVRDCRVCSNLLSADALFRASLRSHRQMASPFVLGRIRQEMASPVKRPWFERLRKNTLMKITIPAIVAVAIAATIVSVPRSAVAATPTATFRHMKAAVLANAGKTTDASLVSWVGIESKGVPSAVYIVGQTEANAAPASAVVQVQHGVPVSLNVDLNEADYKVIAFGADRNHLVLKSKKSGGDQTVLAIDRTTNLPVSVLLEHNVSGKWTPVQELKVNPV
jgi:hypothetical protein